MLTGHTTGAHTLTREQILQRLAELEALIQLLRDTTESLKRTLRNH
jgi:hypothetical protein